MASTVVVAAPGDVTKEQAEKACAKVESSMRKMCVMDVMATGDLELAEGGFM